MFKDGLTKDFGVVPHGAQLFHRFPITNIYAVPMQIVELRTSCGCVTATPSKRVLEPRETVTIDVSMDTRRFTGAKTATIRVAVGPQFASSADLQISATSRQDTSFEPGEVNFKQVVLGDKVFQKVRVEYNGQLEWQIKEVIVPRGLPIDVQVTETHRKAGKVGYVLDVTLRSDAPLGLWKDMIQLRTNRAEAILVPLLIQANVVPGLTLSAPNGLNLGSVKTDEPYRCQIVVQANKPFRILEVGGLDNVISLEIPASEKSQRVQLLKFRCLFDKPGKFKRELKIKTDAQEAPASVTIEATVEP